VDQGTAEPTLEDLELAFPDVECRRQVSGLYYAYDRAAPDGKPVAGPAEDTTDLRDLLRKRRNDLDEQEWRAHRARNEGYYNSGG
jgi:hypothetical protein